MADPRTSLWPSMSIPGNSQAQGEITRVYNAPLSESRFKVDIFDKVVGPITERKDSVEAFTAWKSPRWHDAK